MSQPSPAAPQCQPLTFSPGERKLPHNLILGTFVRTCCLLIVQKQKWAGQLINLSQNFLKQNHPVLSLMLNKKEKLIFLRLAQQRLLALANLIRWLMDVKWFACLVASLILDPWGGASSCSHLHVLLSFPCLRITRGNHQNGWDFIAQMQCSCTANLGLEFCFRSQGNPFCTLLDCACHLWELWAEALPGKAENQASFCKFKYVSSCSWMCIIYCTFCLK